MTDEFEELVQVLKLGGLWFDKNENFQKIRFILLWVCSIFNIADVLFHGLRKTLASSFLYTPVVFMLCIQSTFIFINFEDLTKLIELLKKLSRENQRLWSHQISLRKTKIIRKTVSFYKKLLTIMWAGYFVLPFIVDSIFILTKYKSTHSLNIPWLVSGFMEDNEDNYLFYFYFFISTLWSILAFSCNFGAEGGLLLVMTYSRIHLKIINLYLLSLRSCNFNKTTKKKFIKIINNHVVMIRVYNHLNNVYGSSCAGQNLVLSICICICLFSIKKVNNPGVELMSSLCLMLFIFMCFFSCYLGEELKNEGEILSENLYELPWLEMNSEYRKMVNMMLRQSVRPMVVSYRGRKTLSLSSLTQILHSSYTYFML